MQGHELELALVPALVHEPGLVRVLGLVLEPALEPGKELEIEGEYSQVDVARTGTAIGDSYAQAIEYVNLESSDRTSDVIFHFPAIVWRGWIALVFVPGFFLE